ncbi:hypothetical protein VNO80_23132 [Phaseolus coccineus]|uniref:Uncharacterized protein n=1 Tax=Phaseolus coccineus TaxID=3886 RepID=A0AAN9QZF9_PHACN
MPSSSDHLTSIKNINDASHDHVVGQRWDLGATVRSRRLDRVSGNGARWKRRRSREGWPNFLNKVSRVLKSHQRSPPLPNWTSP